MASEPIADVLADLYGSEGWVRVPPSARASWSTGAYALRILDALADEHMPPSVARCRIEPYLDQARRLRRRWPRRLRLPPALTARSAHAGPHRRGGTDQDGSSGTKAGSACLASSASSQGPGRGRDKERAS